MGRPSCCCSNCYSIWAIDTNDGRVLWKKDYGYIYSISEYGDYVFILTVDGDYQVKCLRKESGTEVDEKSFNVSYFPSLGQVYALDADNIFVYSSRGDQQALFRYVDQELVNVYKFSSPKYKILNDKLIGYGGFDEDYSYYMAGEQTDNSITFRFKDVINCDSFSLHFTVVHEKYNITFTLSTVGVDLRILNSSKDGLTLDDIIDSVSYASDFITVVFKDGLESQLDNVLSFGSPSNTVSSTYSIYNRLFGRIPLTYLPKVSNVAVTDGLNNLVEACVQGIAFTSGVEDVYYSHGEMFDVICMGNGPTTLPSLIEVFKLKDLDYERNVFTDNNSDAVDFSESTLNKYWYMAELNPAYDNLNFQLYQLEFGFPSAVFQPLNALKTGKKIKRTYTKDNNQKYSYNRNYSYGVNMPLQDSNHRTTSPYMPTNPVISTPLETISTYVNVNSASTMTYYKDMIRPYGSFISSNNSLNEGYIKNICSAVRVNDINYDITQDKYLLNCEKMIHWIYLRNQYFSSGVMDGTVVTENVVVTGNAAGISPTYVNNSVTNSNPDYGPTVMYFPNESNRVGGLGNPIQGPTGYNFGGNFNDSTGWSYIVTQNQPDSKYVTGYFAFHDKSAYRTSFINNMYGFSVRVNQVTGDETGQQYESEKVWHKFTELVYHTLSSDSFNGLTNFRTVYTSPANIEMISTDLASFTSDFREPIRIFNGTPPSYVSIDYLDATYGVLETIGGYQIANDFAIEYNPEINQPKKLPLDKYLLTNTGSNNYGIYDISLHEDDSSANIKQRLDNKNNINLNYFKNKSKLIYDIDYNQEITNSEIRKITNDNNQSYIYYKSQDGNLVGQIDIYHIRYNRNQSEVSTICPLLVFHPIDAYDLKNGQANISIVIKKVNLINGVKNYSIRRIERDIDLMDGDLTPILNELNSISSGFEFLGGNANIKDDYVFILYDSPGSSVPMFSGNRELTTTAVTISDSVLENGLIDNTYFYSA